VEWRAILAASLVGCTAPKQPAAAAQSCLDRQLAAKGLNQFGDPPDTVYPGGTPLFDEKTGKRTDRAAYVFARHPDIALACDGGP
jgi:hypothetical protein